MRAIADHPHGTALADLSRAVGLSASTALRQLRSLEAAEFAVRRADGCWVPGPELLRIARNLSATATLPRLAEPVLSSLAEVLGESAYLAEAVDDMLKPCPRALGGSSRLGRWRWLRRGVSCRQCIRDIRLPDTRSAASHELESDR